MRQRDATRAKPRHRRFGITTLAAFAAIAGALSALGSIGLLAVGPPGALATILSLVTLAFGILYLVLAYGLWTLQPWAWPLGVGLLVASIALTFLNVTQGLQHPVGAIFTAAISAVGLLYFYRVRAAFGR